MGCSCLRLLGDLSYGSRHNQRTKKKHRKNHIHARIVILPEMTKNFRYHGFS